MNDPTWHETGPWPTGCYKFHSFWGHCPLMPLSQVIWSLFSIVSGSGSHGRAWIVRELIGSSCLLGISYFILLVACADIMWREAFVRQALPRWTVQCARLLAKVAHWQSDGAAHRYCVLFVRPMRTMCLLEPSAFVGGQRLAAAALWKPGVAYRMQIC